MMQLKDYHLSGTFSKRSYRKELVCVLMRNFLLNTFCCNKNQNRQSTASKTVFICDFYQKTGLLMYVYFLLYVYLFYILTNWFFNTHLTSSLNLADLPFLFIMPVTTISTITFYLNMLFLNFGMQSFSKGF